MVVESELKKLFHELLHRQYAVLSHGGSDITVRIVDEGDKLSLTSSIYYGSNFIPFSVRECLKQKPAFDKNTIKTYLTVNESEYQIYIHYLGATKEYFSLNFKNLLDEFSFLASEWREYLDNHDKNDLIYVRAAK